MPRWLALLTYGLALFLLLVTTLNLWATLVFPGWVLVVSVLFLIRSHTESPGAGDAGASEPGSGS